MLDVHCQGRVRFGSGGEWVRWSGWQERHREGCSTSTSFLFVVLRKDSAPIFKPQAAWLDWETKSQDWYIIIKTLINSHRTHPKFVMIGIILFDVLQEKAPATVLLGFSLRWGIALHEGFWVSSHGQAPGGLRRGQLCTAAETPRQASGARTCPRIWIPCGSCKNSKQASVCIQTPRVTCRQVGEPLNWARWTGTQNKSLCLENAVTIDLLLLASAVDPVMHYLIKSLNGSLLCNTLLWFNGKAWINYKFAGSGSSPDWSFIMSLAKQLKVPPWAHLAHKVNE